jgi:hypothetical protein
VANTTICVVMLSPPFSGPIGPASAIIRAGG